MGRLRQSVVLHEALGAEEHESEGVVVALGGWDVRGQLLLGLAWTVWWDPPTYLGPPIPKFHAQQGDGGRPLTSACQLRHVNLTSCCGCFSTLLQLEQLSAVGGGSF